MIRRILQSSRRRQGALLIVLLVVLGAALGLAAMVQRPLGTTLELGKGRYTVRVASSPADREKGLSGTAPLLKSQGMLFVFDADGQWGFWMKGMNYPIDIIWLNQSKAVIDIAENASPASYPDTVFRPKAPARYVLELAAGEARDASIVVGSRATFSLRASGSGER